MSGGQFQQLCAFYLYWQLLCYLQLAAQTNWYLIVSSLSLMAASMKRVNILSMAVLYISLGIHIRKDRFLKAGLPILL